MTLVQTVIGAVIAVGLVVAGVALLAGPGWALLAAGLLLLLGVVVLYDSEKPVKPKGGT